jgi:hypothetical protein
MAQFLGPDQVLRTNFNFTTNTPQRFFFGVKGSSAVGVQVSIRGGGWTSDNEFIVVDGDNFTIPNPSIYPQGLDLLSGPNSIRVRDILSVGFGSVSTLNAVLNHTTPQGTPPTGVSIERFSDRVRVSFVGVEDTNVQGYHLYATTEQGGTTTGYVRVNSNLITDYEPEEVRTSLGVVEAQYPAQTDTDPLRVEVVATQVDSNGTTVATDISSFVEVPDTTSTLESRVEVMSVSTLRRYSFDHYRLGTPDTVPPTYFSNVFANLADSEPIFYVVSAVYFDPDQGIEYESPLSVEVVGSPLGVVPDVQSLPVLSRQQILQNTVMSIFRTRPDLKVDPGSVLRDTFIDPMSSEVERLRFLMDFLYRASSFPSLLQIDDPDNLGESLAVSRSPYKQALGRALFLSTDTEVQDIIDRAFEKIAGNFGETRSTGSRSFGEVTFYTSRVPRTFPIPLGTEVRSGSAVFRTLTSASIPFESSARYYNPTLRRYQVRVPVRAVTVGPEGNVGKDEITSGAPSGLSVTNEARTRGGKPEESNRALAERIQRKISSSDVSTVRGYERVLSETGNIQQFAVVQAGSEFMLRDLVGGVHLGGKTDVWVRGSQVVTTTDTFAFSYEKKRDVLFDVLGDPSEYTFIARESSLSATNPIASMLDVPELGMGLRNVTTGEDFDLTGVEVISYDTIRLSLSVSQPTMTLGDVILGDFRLQTSNRIVPSRQPVLSLVSLVGDISGTLDSGSYSLYRKESPFLLGRSTRASDYVVVSQTPSSLGSLVSVTNELHTIVGSYVEYVNRLGAESLTLVVQSEDGLTTYRGPRHPSGVSDYTILEGDTLGIRRTTGSAIPDGSTIRMSYEHAQNFVLTYETNLVVSTAQTVLDNEDILNADPLAKESYEVPIDVSATIVLTTGAVQSDVDNALRDRIESFLFSIRERDSLRRSDLIGTINNTQGVSYIVLPLSKMVRAEGSFVLREPLGSTDAIRLNGVSTSTNGVWLFTQRLNSATVDGGGDETHYVSVSKDDVDLTLVSSSVGSLPQQAQIIGATGAVLEGYTDDATLLAQGYDATEIPVIRAGLTGNRVLVSLPNGDSPTSYRFHASYVVADEDRETDINFWFAEYPVVGTLSFTFDEER